MKCEHVVGCGDYLLPLQRGWGLAHRARPRILPNPPTHSQLVETDKTNKRTASSLALRGWPRRGAGGACACWAAAVAMAADSDETPLLLVVLLGPLGPLPALALRLLQACMQPVVLPPRD